MKRCSTWTPRTRILELRYEQAAAEDLLRLAKSRLMDPQRSDLVANSERLVDRRQQFRYLADVCFRQRHN